MYTSKKTLRVLAIVLLFATLSILFVGCKKNNANGNQESSASAGPNNSVSTNEGEAYVMPSVDLNGFVFSVLCRETELLKREVIPSSEMSGEQISEATFNRNLLIEERFNCIIGTNAVSESPESTLTNTFNRGVLSGDTDTHLALGHMHYAGKESLNGTMYNWYDVPGINFNYPWWHHSMIDAITYKNKMYMTASDFCTSSVYFTWIMIFNTQLAENHSIDVYSMVENGTWTLENFQKIVRDSYEGGGTNDIDITKDTFGFVTHDNTAITNWMFALDIPVSRFNANGEYELLLNSDRMINACEEIYKLLFESNNGTLYFNSHNLNTYGMGSHDEAVTKKFGTGQAFFTACRILALENLRDNDLYYGIIPFPKYDEEQAAYHSHVDGRASLMFIPNNLDATTLEKVGMLVEALSYQTYTSVMPEIEDVALLGRYSPDQIAYQMLQDTLAGRSYAFTYVYNEISSAKPYWILTNLMKNDSSSFASEWASAEGVLKRDFREILNDLEDGISSVE